MSKLEMMSPDLTAKNIDTIGDLFPGCITEEKLEDGSLRKAINWDALKQELSHSLVEGPTERYQLDWPGKRESLLASNAPIAKTLRPSREESVNFDDTENLFIEGDNLEVLKLLQKSYFSKVKMIYIDPPYNTGNDFIYNDDFAEDTDEYLERSLQKDEEGNRLVANPESKGRYHSDWLSMMHSRLRLARNLLTDDGVIFISIDDKEQANLKRLCDEIFGEKSFVSNFIWNKRNTTSNSAGVEVSSLYDYTICYKKNSSVKAIKSRVTFCSDRSYPYSDQEGNYRLSIIEKKDSGSYRRDTMKFKILGQPPRDGKRWQIGIDTARELEKKNRFLFDGEMIRLKTYDFEDVDSLSAQPNLLLSHGNSASASKYLNEELFNQSELFNNPKPVNLIQHFLAITDNNDGIILDFFAGSSTTAHAVMKLNAEDGGNRKFIMVQLPEKTDEKSEAFKVGYKNIAEISKERIRRAGKQILESDEIHDDWNQDIGFRVLKVAESNMKDVYYKPQELTQSDLLEQVDNVKENVMPEDLLFQVMLSWGLPLSLPVHTEVIEGKTVYFVADNALIACFDDGITESLVRVLAERLPLRILFRDNYYKDNDTKINAKEILKQFKVLEDKEIELKSI